jgi:hypothetical protein
LVLPRWIEHRTKTWLWWSKGSIHRNTFLFFFRNFNEYLAFFFAIFILLHHLKPIVCYKNDPISSVECIFTSLVVWKRQSLLFETKQLILIHRLTFIRDHENKNKKTQKTSILRYLLWVQLLKLKQTIVLYRKKTTYLIASAHNLIFWKCILEHISQKKPGCALFFHHFSIYDLQILDSDRRLSENY